MIAGNAASQGAKVIGHLYGMWTVWVAKAEIRKFLATHPQPVAAIRAAGNMGVGIDQALEASGHPVSVITELTNQCSILD